VANKSSQQAVMSAFGTKRTSNRRPACPLLGGKVDINGRQSESGFDPKATSTAQDCC
jgi:hypothetical protein